MINRFSQNHSVGKLQSKSACRALTIVDSVLQGQVHCPIFDLKIVK